MKGEVEFVDRTKSFALRVVKMFSALPKTAEAQVLGKQVLRSGTSVGANYREAQRARSKAEFIAKIGDCLKELDETAYWLDLLAESGIVTPTNPDFWLGGCFLSAKGGIFAKGTTKS